MRILNRPMFKYGGPIKEGVMHGMKNGGSMGEPQGKNLVGDPVYPKTDGRAHHFAFGGLGLAGLYAGARATLPWIIRQGARYLPKVKRMFGTTTPASITRGGPRVGEAVGSHTPITINPAKFNPNWLGRDPLVRTVGAAGKAIFNPTTGGLAAKGLRMATSPSSVLIGGLWYANGRWFNKKGDELDPNSTEVVKAKAGSKDYGPHTKGAPTMTASMIEAKAKADKEKRINALLDTMGYDKARKNAAYDALIDAGRMVSERGTLDPKNIGRELIDPIVAATSQRFDKPEQIREAVGLMQTKADIQKEMTKDETALANRVKELQILTGQKTLAGDTLEETAEAFFTRHGQWPSGELLGNLARNKNIDITEVVDTSTTATGLKDIGDPVEFMEGRIKKFKEKGIEIPPGNYVVEDAIIIIDAEGNVRRR